MIGYFAVAALALPIASAEVPVAPPPRVAETLPAKIEQAVRQAVYEKVKIVNVAGWTGLPMVELPTAVAEAYAKKPGAVLGGCLLLRIAGWASPWESRVAIVLRSRPIR